MLYGCLFASENMVTQHFNKPGTAQVGAISKAQKQQKDFKVSNYSLLKYLHEIKIEKNFRIFFEVSGKLRSAEKFKRGDPQGDPRGFESHP